jgi:uncharacterized protein
VSRRFRLMIIAALACPVAFHSADAAGKTLQIGWSDLRPAAQADAGQALPASAATAPNRGETLSRALGGLTVEMSGYALPTDREGDLVYQFLLVPWTGACSHMPAPPPNQMVLVTPDRPYKLSEVYEPVSVSGTLKPGLEKTQLFILDGVTVLQSGYQIGGATVAHVQEVPETAPPPTRTPWRFLQK